MRDALFERAHQRARRAAQVRAAAAVAGGAMADREDLEQEALVACWRALATSTRTAPR